MEALLSRISLAEKRIEALAEKYNDGVARAKKDLQARGIFGAKFVTVPSNYYDRSLEERGLILNASVPHLCKTILFENTAADHFDISDRTNSRYYCVVVQYAAKFDAELLRDVIHDLRPPSERLPRKRFHFQLAPEDISEKLTGFMHNAVTPFGMATADIPVVLCSRCASVNPAYIYLGGGKVDVKLGLPLSDFIRATNPIIATVSQCR